MTLTVLDPTARSADATTSLNAQPATVAGLSVGLLDNGKPNSDRFLAALADELRRRGARPLVPKRKSNIGRLAEPELIETLSLAADLVVVGVGDCAGCCSCSTLDAIALEAAGRPTVMVCTSEFLTTAQISAATAGVRDYPFTVIDHPFGALTAEQVADRAREVAERLWGPPTDGQ
ncbi:UGSC family (seleno)protein [Nakamurella leprariae]|uniref:UGSC-like domain-containing protein n=1 Tax=Nakamurella leprariae TaxID=2803911 RepID=A0A938YA92_9ACTN|nr:hypothetical protein [Nakamurella leprariae]MBM9468765.1 hypothetical protein [Nakamurella leprariae]